MLVVGMEATFTKKATGLTRFPLHRRPRHQASHRLALATGEGQT
jgi:hypothetical protein